MKTSSPGQVKWKQVCKTRGVYIANPNNARCIREIPHIFALFDPHRNGSHLLVLRTHCCYTVSFSFKFKVFWYKFTKKGSRQFSFTANLTGFVSLLSFNQTIRRTQRNGFMVFFHKDDGTFLQKQGTPEKNVHILANNHIPCLFLFMENAE